MIMRWILHSVALIRGQAIYIQSGTKKDAVVVKISNEEVKEA